jgi:hypothetical protein
MPLLAFAQPVPCRLTHFRGLLSALDSEAKMVWGGWSNRGSRGSFGHGSDGPGIYAALTERAIHRAKAVARGEPVGAEIVFPGKSNGANGHGTNGHANGHANGAANGTATDQANGHAPIFVSKKLVGGEPDPK